MQLHAISIAIQQRTRGRGVEDPRRAAKAKKDGVRSARDRGAFDVEVVGGVVDLEKISGNRTRADSSNASAAGRIRDLVPWCRGHVVGGIFGIGGINQRLVHAGKREIIHEILGEGLDLVGHILEVCAQPAARESFGCDPADIGRFRNHEG